MMMLHDRDRRLTRLHPRHPRRHFCSVRAVRDSQGGCGGGLCVLGRRGGVGQQRPQRLPHGGAARGGAAGGRQGTLGRVSVQ